MIGISNDETNFPNKLLLTTRQVKILRKPFAGNSSASIELLKTTIKSRLLELVKKKKKKTFNSPSYFK